MVTAGSQPHGPVSQRTESRVLAEAGQCQVPGPGSVIVTTELPEPDFPVNSEVSSTMGTRKYYPATFSDPWSC